MNHEALPVYTPGSFDEECKIDDLLDDVLTPYVDDAVPITEYQDYDIRKDLRHDDSFIYYPDAFETHYNELPEHMGTECFLEPVSWSVLTSKESLKN